MKSQIFKNIPPIAHRGFHSKTIYENTLSSFKQAIDQNYAIELDVHLTCDHKVVVFHDDNLMRMLGDKRQIKDISFKEIKKIRFPNSNETIPLLLDVLKLIDGKVPLLIELKTDQKTGILEKEVVKIIKNYKGICYFQSFRYSSIRYIKKKTKKKVGLLIHKKKKPLILNYYLYRILKIDFISYPIKCCPNKKIEKLYKKMPILFWTIKNKNKSVFYYHDQIIFENKT